MLFLYRPRQTRMPFRRPLQQTDQAAYNRELQEKFSATRRVPQPMPAPGGAPTPPAVGLGPSSGPDLTARLKELAELHDQGALSDEEFAAAKAKVLGGAAGSP
jgi:Short C-terminal domain